MSSASGSTPRSRPGRSMSSSSLTRAAAKPVARAPSPAPDPTWDSIQAPVAAIDAFLTGYIHGLKLPPHLIAAIEYALLGGGKRLRPLLCWHCCAAVGG